MANFEQTNQGRVEVNPTAPNPMMKVENKPSPNPSVARSLASALADQQSTPQEFQRPQPNYQPMPGGVGQPQPYQNAQISENEARSNFVPTSLNELVESSNEVINQETLMSKINQIDERISNMSNESEASGEDNTTVDVDALVKQEFAGYGEEGADTLNKLKSLLKKNNEEMSKKLSTQIIKGSVSFEDKLNREIPHWNQLKYNDANFALWLQQNPESFNIIQDSMKRKNMGAIKAVVNHYSSTNVQQPQPNVNRGMPQSPYPSTPSVDSRNYMISDDPDIVDIDTFVRIVDKVSSKPSDESLKQMTPDDWASFVKKNIKHHVNRTFPYLPTRKS